MRIPTLVVGSVENDFLPYTAHAERISRMVRGAKLLKLEHGEGHFVYLDECALPLEAQGVKLCSDRQSINRNSVHDALEKAIHEFLSDHFH